MDSMTETLWNCFCITGIPASKELESLKEQLYGQLSAAVSEEFSDQLRETNFLAEDFYAREVFQRGFYLGGQFSLSMLSEDFTPA